jgi:alpha-beta hydrolase superfamily lysophospholipase
LEPVAAACKVETFAASDGYVFQYRRYPARGKPRGRVVAVHGIQSHGGWYAASCQRLAEAGWEVAFLDRRGGGLNQQARGDAPGFHRLVADIHEFIGAKCGRPPYLLGISWGGKLGVALEHLHPGCTAGLILLTPGLCPRVRPPLRHRLGIALARLVQPGRLFPIPLDDPELFTATPRWQQFIRDDPLALRQATARLLLHSVRLDGYLRFVPKYVRAPVLLLLAGRDRIIRNAPTRRLVERFASADKEVVEYPEAHHTLEFEPEPDRFIDDLQRWLERHSKPAPV